MDRLRRLQELERQFALKDELPLILEQNEDGTYKAIDQHHKGRVYSEEDKRKYPGVVILWDLPK